MLSTPHPTLATRWLAVAGLGLLTLLAAPASAQTTPPPKVTFRSPLVPSVFIYIDAQLADSAALAALPPKSIASLVLLKGKAARVFNPAAAGRGILVLTTQSRENNAAVQAFRQRAKRVGEQYDSTSDADIQAENNYPPAGVRYYLNGSLITWQKFRLLDRQSITQVRALNGARATDFAHEADVNEIIFITTQP